MYVSHSSSGSPVVNSSPDGLFTHKETLHISPHIAAHKSAPLTSSSGLQSSLVDLSSIPASSTVLTTITTTPEITAYRVNSSTSNGNRILEEFHPSSSTSKLTPASYLALAQKDRSSLTLGGMSSCVRTTLTNLARVNPEDLSASSESKMSSSSTSPVVASNDYTLSTMNLHKTSQNLYTVTGDVPASLLPNILGRNSTYFRAPESPNLTGQPQAILVSGLVTCGDSSIEHTSSPTTLSALPPSTAIMGEVLGLVGEPRIKKEEDVVAVRPATLMQPQLLPVQQQCLSTSQQHRDMMRHALQAAVESGVAPRTAEQELIEYSYSAGDIHDLLMLNIAGGTSSVEQSLRGGNSAASSSFQMSQLGGSVTLSSSSLATGTNVASISGLNVIDAATGASVIMMPASCSSHSPDLISATNTGGSNAGGLMAANLVSPSGQFIGDSSIIMAAANSGPTNLEMLSAGTVFNSINVMDLNTQGGVNVHSLASVNGDEGLLSNGIRNAISAAPGIVAPAKSKKTKTSKLSEGDLCLKRMKLAQVMREKRASETEDQKKKRRLREAERMRRRRALESEEQKAQRRLEAAERARLRRATMNDSERLLDRRKAAERMRQRRLNEGEQQKQLRRRRAAERMRKRRSEETPEQRAFRRKTLAIMMKTRRRKKQREGSASCSANNSLSDDGYREVDMTPPRHLGDLTSDFEEVKAQDLSSTMHLDTHVSLHSPDLLMKGHDHHREEYVQSDLLHGVKYCGDHQRTRKLIVMDGVDPAKLVSEPDGHLMPRVITAAPTCSSTAGLIHRKAVNPLSTCDAASPSSSSQFTSRIDYPDVSLRANTTSTEASSVLLPHHSRLSCINVSSPSLSSSSPSLSSSSPSLSSSSPSSKQLSTIQSNSSLFHYCQDLPYSSTGATSGSSGATSGSSSATSGSSGATSGSSGAASSIPSHVPVLRNVTSSTLASVFHYPQKCSVLNTSSSANVVGTQASLPTILTSSKFAAAENLSNGVTELTAVGGADVLDPTSFAPGTIISSSASAMYGSDNVQNGFSVSNGSSCSVSNSNTIYNATRSILRIQNSSSTLNVEPYSSQDDLGHTEESSDTSLRQYSTKGSAGSSIVMSRVDREGLNMYAKSTAANAPVTNHEAARSSIFCDDQSEIVCSTAPSNGSSRSSYKGTSTLYSPASVNQISECSVAGNNASSSASCAVVSAAAPSHSSSVISSPAGLTTIVLNQSLSSTQRSAAS